MAGKSDYLENKVVDLILRGQTYTAPHLYVGLYTATPSDAGGGTECSGGSYARVDLGTPGLTIFTATQGGTAAVSSGTTGVSTNANVITFPSPTGAWGYVQWFGIFDAASGGNLLYWGALTVPKTINSGDAAPSFAIGALSITED